MKKSQRKSTRRSTAAAKATAVARGLPASDPKRLDQIGFLLGRAYYTYIGFLQKRLDAEGLGENFKPGMGSLLFALFREDNRTVTSLAQELHLAKSTMTGMVARMREAGLITLSPDASDGRSFRLQLTQLARSLEARCVQLAVTVENELLRDFSKDEAARLRSALQQLVAAMSDELDRPADADQSKPKRKDRP